MATIAIYNIFTQYSLLIIYFSDYYDGLIIDLKYISNIKTLHVSTTPQVAPMVGGIACDTGVTLSQLIDYLVPFGYDLSSLAGIPSTVGGATYGNAGAYGMEFGNIISKCHILDKNGAIYCMNRDECQFGYRSSIFKKNSDHDKIIIGVELDLEKIPKDNSSNIRDKINQILNIRSLRYPSQMTLGCVFCNFPDKKIYVSKILDDLNLKGHHYKDLMLSDSHANVILNKSNSNSNDLNEFIKIISDRIEKSHGFVPRIEIEQI